MADCKLSGPSRCTVCGGAYGEHENWCTQDTNPTPTQPETLEPSIHALTVLVCQDCIDLKGEMCNNPQCVFCRRTMAEVQHYLDAMLLCPVVDGKRLILVGNAVTDEDSTRRAAVTAPRGDVATTARNRDVAQRVVMSTESVLGERFNIATRHELADRITAALDAAATASPTPAEQPSSLIADAIAKVREMEAENKRNYEYWKSIASDPTDMGVMKFLCWSGEDSRVIAMLESLAPPERTRVEGKRGCVRCGHNERFNQRGECQYNANPDKLPCGCQCGYTTPPAISDSARRAAEWRDEGGHVWEIRPNVDCVECPHCCFTFAAVHTDGYGNAYSCPNCKGCPDAAAPADNDAESPRVVVNETKA